MGAQPRATLAMITDWTARPDRLMVQVWPEGLPAPNYPMAWWEREQGSGGWRWQALGHWAALPAGEPLPLETENRLTELVTEHHTLGPLAAQWGIRTRWVHRQKLGHDGGTTRHEFVPVYGATADPDRRYPLKLTLTLVAGGENRGRYWVVTSETATVLDA